MESGSLNLLEPSGPHRAIYGTPLPFTYPGSANCQLLIRGLMICTGSEILDCDW
jgi:hypothetical protein